MSSSSTVRTAGTRHLRWTSSNGPGPGPSYNPHFHYNPGYSSGVLEGGFALRVEPGATVDHEWRDWRGSPYRTGPSLHVGTDGTLSAAGRELMKLPQSKWVRIDIVCGVGEQAKGAYSLKVKAPGQAVKRFEGLPGHAEFKALTWMGWTAGGTKAAVFYLDDIHLRPRK